MATPSKRPGIKYIDRPFEVKTVNKNGTFTGYGSVFGELDSYRDIVLPGAFTESLKEDFSDKERKVPMLWQHDWWSPIGVYTKIEEDEHGLYVEGECNMDVQQGRECHSLMKQGALSGLSIGYSTQISEWDEDQVVRSLKKVKLYEVSPVTFPAGDNARVLDVKSIDSLVSLSDVERYLRDAYDVSRKDATVLIARIKAIPAQSDSDDVESKVDAALQSLKTITIK